MAPEREPRDQPTEAQQPYGGGQNAPHERLQPEAWSRPPPEFSEANDEVPGGEDLDHRDQQGEKNTARFSSEEDPGADAGFVFGGRGHLPASNSREGMKLCQRLQGGLDQMPDPNNPSEARSDSRPSAS